MTTDEARHAVFVLGEGGRGARVSRWYDGREGADRALSRMRAGAEKDLLPLEALPEGASDGFVPDAGAPSPPATDGAEEDLNNGYEDRSAVAGDAHPFKPLGRRLSPEELYALEDGDRVLMRLSLLHPNPEIVFEGEREVLVFGGLLAPNSFPWAEYRLPEDLDPYGGLMLEGYYMEIFELEEGRASE